MSDREDERLLELQERSLARLRELIAEEREMAEKVVEWPVEATDAVYRAAKSATDKQVDRIERMWKTKSHPKKESMR